MFKNKEDEKHFAFAVLQFKSLTHEPKTFLHNKRSNSGCSASAAEQIRPALFKQVILKPSAKTHQETT